MRIGVPQESAAGERRVALVPDSIARLVKSGLEVVVQRRAGAAAFFADADYDRAGARLVDTAADALRDADIVVKVQKPSVEEVALLRSGAIVIGLLAPAASRDLLTRIADRGVTALAMEHVPRITRAQSMDALSSQATVVGYQAVLLGATRLGKLLPMLTTAAGTLAPAKVFVLGAGVAGLQAIATARRLGGVVSAFDVRPVVREQVQSLGATFVSAEAVAAEGQGGYAAELAEDQQQRVLAAVGGHITDMDLVITTAQVPGRPAPRLITDEMVASMRPGSVIVDVAAETGGNCALTRLGETVVAHDVSILGPSNLPSSLPYHASQMYSRNLQTLLQHLVRDGRVVIDPKDEITKAMLVVHGGGFETDMTATAIVELYVFILAGFVGFLVITRVPPLLHTPLMSATNAISGISLVGSLVIAGADRNEVSTILGFIAVTAATINVVGGFLITDRMLKMFKREEREPKP